MVVTRTLLTTALAAGLALDAAAQQVPLDRRSSLALTFPEESCVAVVGGDWGDSTASNRGGAMLLELRTSLMLKNNCRQRLRGITLQVTAEEVTPGGKAAVSVPSLDVPPGEAFPVRVDVRLLRPLRSQSGPLVLVSLDGLLFADLSFYGPNRLNSRRSMTVWELEARRDRRHFQSVLEARGPEGLRQELLASLSRQAELSQLGTQMARGGRSTVVEPERSLDVAFLSFPDAPVELTDGFMRVAGNQARLPQLAVRNRTERPIRSVEVGWLLKDPQGKEHLGGSLPAELALAPYQQGRLTPSALLRFSSPNGQPIEIDAVTAFVQQVEFQDGRIWLPSRDSQGDPALRRALPLSVEEQRLAEMYRRKGLPAVVEELKRF